MALRPPPARTGEEFERLLATTTNYEERPPTSGAVFDLARMRALLRDLDDPQEGQRTVHVAGSKGKGSVCRMVASVLRAAGEGPVGLYTSPHLEAWTERIDVDGVALPADDVATAAAPLFDVLAAWPAAVPRPTYFEVFTAAAHLAFRARGVRASVLEVGLGGRLDATNVCRPAATAVVSIEREHVAILGDTVERIAAEKAGILKAGVPCVGGLEPGGPADRVLVATAREVGAPLVRLGVEVVTTDAGSGPGPRTRVRVAGPDGAPALAVELPIAGVHQARNAAVAVAIARLLGVPDAAIRDGLARVSLPGRLEPVLRAPTVVVDAAHTPASARTTREGALASFPHRAAHLVFGALADKDVEGILAAFRGFARRVVVCALPTPRALPPSDLAALAVRVLSDATSAPVSVSVAPDVATGLALALRAAAPDDLVLATGSVYLAGAARAAARALPGFLPRDAAPPRAAAT